MSNFAIVVVNIYICYLMYPYLRDILTLKWKNKIQIDRSQILWESKINLYATSKYRIFFFIIVKVAILYMFYWIFSASFRLFQSNVIYEYTLGMLTLLTGFVYIFVGGFIYSTIDFKKMFLTKNGLILQTRFSGDILYKYGQFIMYEENHFRIPQEVIAIESEYAKKYFIMPIPRPINSNVLHGNILGDIVTFSKICKQQTETAIKAMDTKSRVALFLKYYEHIEIIFNEERNHNIFTIDFSP
ncbi:hypothetical protein CQA53_11415, partial [Helicobacter didelphidarum]